MYPSFFSQNSPETHHFERHKRTCVPRLFRVVEVSRVMRCRLEENERRLSMRTGFLMFSDLIRLRIEPRAYPNGTPSSLSSVANNSRSRSSPELTPSVFVESPPHAHSAIRLLRQIGFLRRKADATRTRGIGLDANGNWAKRFEKRTKKHRKRGRRGACDGIVGWLKLGSLGGNWDAQKLVCEILVLRVKVGTFTKAQAYVSSCS